MFKNRFFQLALIAAGITSLTSCEDEPTDNTGLNEGQYVLHVRSDGEESPNYMTTSAKIDEGNISIEGKGIEQLGWRYSIGHNNTVFSIGYGDNYVVGYQLDESGVLVEKGKFAFEKTLDCAGILDDKTLVAIQADRAAQGRVIHVIDAENISIKNKVSTDFNNFAGDSLALWPTSIQYRDNRLFVSLYPLRPDGTFTTPSVDTAYVAVLSYPDLILEKVIKDTRTSPIGVYGASDGMLKTDKGDIYTLSSSSAAGGFTKVTKPSGILRIRSGETEFDQNYFLDFEDLTGGEKLVHFAYVGNGLALAQASSITNETPDDLWASHDVRNPAMKLYVVNLESQSVEEVSGVPLHGGSYGFPHLVEDGKVYVHVRAADEKSFIYEIDPKQATGVKGAEVEALEAAGIYKLQ